MMENADFTEKLVDFRKALFYSSRACEHVFALVAETRRAEERRKRTRSLRHTLLQAFYVVLLVVGHLR